MEKNKNTLRIVRTSICIILILVLSGHLIAQEGKMNPVHVGLIYPISTNGITAPLDTNQFSLHLIAGVSQQEDACLIAGVSGFVRGNAYGTLVSGVSNHVGGDAKGIQIAGILNRVKGSAQGIQVAGVVNTTGDTAGFQVAGLMNRATDVHMQVAGLINVAKRVKGVQIAGLVNIAEKSDYPIGVLNFIKEGEQQLGLMADETGNAWISLRSGGRVLYGIVGLGYHFQYDEARYGIEAGIGAHVITAKMFRLNAEVASAAMTNFTDGVYGKQSFRALAALRLSPRFELFAGPTFNHLLFESDQPDIRNGRYLWHWQGDDVSNGCYLGGLVGLQFSL